MGVTLITHITHVCKENIYNKEKSYLTYFIIGFALEAKNCFLWGSKFFPLRVGPILEARLERFFSIFRGYA